MNKEKKLIIISNEKVSENEDGFYCDNIDMKSIPEGLIKNLEVFFIARKSHIKKPHQINLKRIQITSNIFAFLISIYRTFNSKQNNYLLISVTPYTFFAALFLFIFRKKTFVYLRSNGYEEYKYIFGFIGPLIYHFLYTTVTLTSSVITCQKRLVKKKESNLVFPSEIDIHWLQNIKQPLLDKPRILYVGRVKVEKGIFSLLKIFNEITDDIELSIVGKVEEAKLKNKKINFLGYGYESQELIKIYDNHNILILPSFTEAHPKVVDESLARARPVIIFEEISHIIQNRIGLFVSKRNTKSLHETIKFIMNNYSNIQKNMSKNKLPTKEKFISQMINILS